MWKNKWIWKYTQTIFFRLIRTGTWRFDDVNVASGDVVITGNAIPEHNDSNNNIANCFSIYNNDDNNKYLQE